MTSLPKISVVTPSMNQARFIEATLASVHSSGYPYVEHIVIDGGSTDGSIDIIESYEDRLSYWVSEPDRGQTDALRKGFDIATGDVLAWLNSDDLYEPHTLWEVAEFFSRHPRASFVYGDAMWIDAEGAVIKPKKEHRWSRFVFLHDHNFIPQPSTFWRRALYEEVGGLQAEFDLAMDADLWIRFAELSHPEHVASYWSRMRFYAEQKNTRLRDRSVRELASIRDRYSPGSSGLTRRVQSGAARSLRIAMKAAAGGYPSGELRSHLGKLTGRGSWEERAAERSSAPIEEGPPE